jgi:hypothetical protein
MIIRKIGGRGGAPIDPYWASVVLYAPFQAADGVTAMYDLTGRHVLTANGDAQIDTSQKPFGASSLLLDGDERQRHDARQHRLELRVGGLHRRGGNPAVGAAEQQQFHRRRQPVGYWRRAGMGLLGLERQRNLQVPSCVECRSRAGRRRRRHHSLSRHLVLPWLGAVRDIRSALR